MKQIEIYDQCFELYGPDKGRTWSSSPRSIVAYGRRKKMLRLELRKRFEPIGDMPDPDSNVFSEPEIPKSLIGRQGLGNREVLYAFSSSRSDPDRGGCSPRVN